MSIPLIVNGVTYSYPQQGDKNWAPTLTSWSSAVTSGMLQKAGGSFTLTAETDFGASFGLKVLSIKSKETNIAASGFLRLGNASTGIVWRNAANNADLVLTVNASNQLTFNGTGIGATTALTNGHILVGNVSNQPADVAMSGDITITNAGVTTLGASKVFDANISSSAAIARGKLASVTANTFGVNDSLGSFTARAVTVNKAVITDGDGLPTASTTSGAELAFLTGVTSAVQTQINGKVSKIGDTMSGVLNMGSNKIISVANATSASDAIAYGQMKVISYSTAFQATDNTTTSSTLTTTGLSVTITPASVSNKVRLEFTAYVSSGGGANSVIVSIKRGTTDLGQANGIGLFTGNNSTVYSATATLSIVDSPATTSPTTYTVFFRNNNNSTTVQCGSSSVGSTLTAIELA